MEKFIMIALLLDTKGSTIVFLNNGRSTMVALIEETNELYFSSNFTISFFLFYYSPSILIDYTLLTILQ